MPELFFPRVGAEVRGSGVPTPELPKVERLAVLYSCRFISSKDFRVLVRSRFRYSEELQIRLLELKDRLDFSSTRNNLYRALVDLTQAGPVTPLSLFNAATANDLDAYDLDVAYNRLLARERESLAALQDKPGRCSGADVHQLVRHVTPIIKNLVHRKLAFILNNDPGVGDYEDLINLLSLFTIRVVREYEVQNLEREHLIKNVVVSLKNFTSNLAEAHGRQKRASVRRVKKAPATATAWHLDIDTGEISPVQVRPGPQARVMCGCSLKVFVTHSGKEGYTLVHYKRLYATLEEAVAARELHSEGLYSKRPMFLDLSAHSYDEFQQTCAYLDAEDPNGLSLLRKLKADSEKDEEAQLDLSRLGPVLGEYADLVMNPEGNEFFMAWSHEKGIKINSCSTRRLGTLACRFLGLKEEDVVEAVLSSPASAWSAGAKKRIDSFRESHYSMER